MIVTESPQPIELRELDDINDLPNRILNGEVFIMRQGLQRAGLFDELVEASLEGIRASVGDEVAAKAASAGFDRIHEWVDPSDVPAMTDAVYKTMGERVHTMMDKFVSTVFQREGNFYYERSPNVRFHIPYEMAAAHKQRFKEFSGSHGDGKITAHGPHRDSWVDCPDNLINLWIAIGPVRRGNGLTIFAKDYRKKFAFENGYVAPAEKLQQPMTFDLEPGDAVLFHGDHLHGSELNTTSATRFVVSNRICIAKPHFPHGHHHHYLHAKLAGGPLRLFAQIPANAQVSYLTDRIRRLFRKLGLLKPQGSEQASSGNEASRKDAGGEPAQAATQDDSISLDEFPVGEARAISKTACVIRLDEKEFAAVSRRCPHAGGDLVDGWVTDGRPNCPWHNLSFDPKTGSSACSGMSPLKVYSFEVRENRLYVDLPKGSGNAGASSTM